MGGESFLNDENLSVSKVYDNSEEHLPSDKQKNIDKKVESMAPVRVIASDILLKNRENLVKTLDKNTNQLEEANADKGKSPEKKEEEIESFLQRKNRLLAQKELLLKKKKEERELQLKQYQERQRVNV
jgi:hypothetical protein